MPLDPATPCLIGCARRTWHPEDVGDRGAPEPLEMWETVARQAAADAGAPAAVESLQHIQVVYCQAWQYDDPPGRLAERLGSPGAETTYSGIGGSVPQVLVADTARHILAGRLDLALVVGAEALATRRRLSKEGRKAQWSFPPEHKRPFPFDIPLHPAEVAHHIFEAYLTFALFDGARRAHRGDGLDSYRQGAGQLLADLSEVAARSRDAWFPIRRSATEIITPTPANRMVAYPYTKLMTAIMDVDMAAGLLVASKQRADALGVPEHSRVYLRGWGYAEDPPYVAQRRQLWCSPAMGAAARAALEPAKATPDDVAHFDLYSCFASSLGFASDALDLSPTDGRPMTVTGGLPYHGGPGSNYMTHSIAAMAERLRQDPGSLGLVSGVGMHMTKHVYGLWSSEPPPCIDDLARSLGGSAQEEADGELEVVPITETHRGRATVATYSVLHGRDGEAGWGALVCDLADGSRCYARLEAPEALTEAERTELAGRPVDLEPDQGGVNRAHLV